MSTQENNFKICHEEATPKYTLKISIKQKQTAMFSWKDWEELILHCISNARESNFMRQKVYKKNTRGTEAMRTEALPQLA